MRPAAGIAVVTIEGGPEVRLLDARETGIDLDGLRAWARSLTPPDGCRYVARSYRHPFALVAWHAEPVGIDIERIEGFEEDFAASISTPAERSSPAAATDPDAYVASLWSSKEALAKALGDAVSFDPRRLESPMRWPGLRSAPWRASPLQVPQGHVAWLCWRESGT